MSANREGMSLIINADDFGYCSQRNAGIVEAFCHGVVTSVSLLVNASSSLEAVELAHQYSIPMGLHLNLTEGCPMGKGHKTLIDNKGYFKGKMGFREALHSGGIQVEEIITEIQLQIDWFKEYVGCNPTHIDGHQHIHVLPIVSSTLANIMKENKISVTRNPAECIDNCSWIEPERKTFQQSVVQDTKTACKIFKEANVSFPAHFVGLSTMGNNMTIEKIEKALTKSLEYQETLPVNSSLSGMCTVIEFMVHPGYRSIKGVGGCGEGPDKFALSEEREHELKILTSEHLKYFLEKKQFILSSFSGIQDSQK